MDDNGVRISTLRRIRMNGRARRSVTMIAANMAIESKGSFGDRRWHSQVQVAQRWDAVCVRVTHHHGIHASIMNMINRRLIT